MPVGMSVETPENQVDMPSPLELRSLPEEAANYST